MFAKLGTVYTPRGGGQVVSARPSPPASLRRRRLTALRGILTLGTLAAAPVIGGRPAPALSNAPGSSTSVRADGMGGVDDILAELWRLLTGGGGESQPPPPPPPPPSGGG